jgi:hypothetical protein
MPGAPKTAAPSDRHKLCARCGTAVWDGQLCCACRTFFRVLNEPGQVHVSFGRHRKVKT